MNGGRALLDSSAAVKLVLDEPDSSALRAALRSAVLAGSALLEVEVRRAVRRTAPQHESFVELALENISLVDVDLRVRRRAAVVDPGLLRSLDAIHVATALLVHEPGDVLFTYDDRMAEAARANGLVVESPR